jgi:hypothetical protein
MSVTPPADRFFRAALRTAAPLMVWAAHFAFCYLLIAFGCVAWGPQAPLRAAALGATALALGVVGTQAVWAWRRPGTPLAASVERWSAALALLGIAWTALPAFVLPACQIN